ncbi:phosphatase PAP2 family protein [Mycolicibacterium komossense]|uniref:phosphatase PAP2 family protein n=1 Tax=Mycolicibacterium komossense TaxID=1779 RepID=UPI0021F2EF0B|nr:phosphatase PAP2 family protein [Mycolicibacterium komossense]
MRYLPAAGAIAAVVYATMWVGFVAKWAWLSAIDGWWLQVFHGFGLSHPGWVSFWVVFCVIFGPIGFRVIALPVIGFALVRRDKPTAIFLFVSIELSALVALVAKELGNRPRPTSALVHGESTSFPSGHAVTVTVGVLALLTVFWPSIPNGRKAAVAVGAGALILVVGVARVALNVHNPSDVIAGWALGFLYFVLCLRLLPRPIGFSTDDTAKSRTDHPRQS